MTKFSALLLVAVTMLMPTAAALEYEGLFRFELRPELKGRFRYHAIHDGIVYTCNHLTPLTVQAYRLPDSTGATVDDAPIAEVVIEPKQIPDAIPDQFSETLGARCNGATVWKGRVWFNYGNYYANNWEGSQHALLSYDLELNDPQIMVEPPRERIYPKLIAGSITGAGEILLAGEYWNAWAGGPSTTALEVSDGAISSVTELMQYAHVGRPEEGDMLDGWHHSDDVRGTTLMPYQGETYYAIGFRNADIFWYGKPVVTQEMIDDRGWPDVVPGMVDECSRNKGGHGDNFEAQILLFGLDQLQPDSQPQPRHRLSVHEHLIVPRWAQDNANCGQIFGIDYSAGQLYVLQGGADTTYRYDSPPVMHVYDVGSGSAVPPPAATPVTSPVPVPDPDPTPTPTPEPEPEPDNSVRDALIEIRDGLNKLIEALR